MKPFLTMITLLFVLLLASCEEEPPLPQPEEFLSAGPFQIGRWKHYYAHGDNFQYGGRYYWESVLLYKNKVIDFCTPQGWGGSYLCDAKGYLGSFSMRTPGIVSDAPPAVLVPYGGTSGNSDGELWLFTENEGRLEKKRIALDSSDHVANLQGDRIDSGKDWDYRSHKIIVLNNDTWLITDSLRVLEFSRPIGTTHLKYISTSPDGKYIARIGYLGNGHDDEASKLILVVNDYNDPAVVFTYSIQGLRAKTLDTMADEFGKKFSWNTSGSEVLFKPKSKSYKLVPFTTILERVLLSQTPEKKQYPDMDYFFENISKSSLRDVSATIMRTFGKNEDCECITYSENLAKINIDDLGIIVLKADDKAIHLSNTSEHVSINHLAHVIRDNILDNELKLPGNE